MAAPTTDRVAELEDELRKRDEKIKQLRSEHQEALKLVDVMRERVTASSELLERWIDAFDMPLGDNGRYQWSRELIERWDSEMSLLDSYNALVTQWNRFVGRYNAVVTPRPIGRPLAASEAQVKDVEKRRARGESYRAIGRATGLTLSTIHTIISRKDKPLVDRRMHRREIDRARAKIYRARKRQTPKRDDGKPFQGQAPRARA